MSQLMIRDLNFFQSELSELDDVAGSRGYEFPDIAIATGFVNAFAINIDFEHGNVDVGYGVGVGVAVSLNGNALVLAEASAGAGHLP